MLQNQRQCIKDQLLKRILFYFIFKCLRYEYTDHCLQHGFELIINSNYENRYIHVCTHLMIWSATLKFENYFFIPMKLQK